MLTCAAGCGLPPRILQYPTSSMTLFCVSGCSAGGGAAGTPRACHTRSWHLRAEATWQFSASTEMSVAVTGDEKDGGGIVVKVSGKMTSTLSDLKAQPNLSLSLKFRVPLALQFCGEEFILSLTYSCPNFSEGRL